MVVLSEFFGSGGIAWEVVTSNITAKTNKGYMVDTSGGSKTITLPASPKINDKVGIKDFKKNSENNPITVSRNGQKIEGEDYDFVINVNNQGVTFVYSDTTSGWVRISDIFGPAIYD